MRSLDVIMLKNAEAAGREAAEAVLNEYHQIEKANDAAVYDDARLDRAARRALQDAYHAAFVRELGVTG